MGTKVHCENYLPIFYSSRSVQADTRTKMNLANALPHCADEMVLKEGQSYNILKQETMGSCSGYDKEILKQTMLKHEAIFREQVRELHRLYKVQKLLMDDLKRQYSALSSARTKAGPFLFPFGAEHLKLEGKQNFWDALNRPMVDNDSRGHRHHISGIDCAQSPRSALMEQNLQIGPIPKEIKNVSKEFYRLQPSRSTRRTFDLERPPDELIDDEVTYRIKEDTVSRIANGKEQTPSNFHYRLESESEVQLTLSTGWEKCAKEDGRQTVPSLDLGISEMKIEEAKESKRQRCSEDMTLFSVAPASSEAPTQEILGKQRSSLSNQGFLGGLWGFGQEYHKNKDHRVDCSKFDVEHEGSRKERQSLDIEAGPGDNNGNTLIQGIVWQQPSTASPPRQVEHDGVMRGSLVVHEVGPIHFQDQRGTGCSWSKEEILTGMAITQRNSMLAMGSSIGSSIGIYPAHVMRYPLSISQGLTENTHGEIQPSASWWKNGSSLGQFPLGVNSQIYPVVPAAVDLQMWSSDPDSSSHGKPLVLNGINGTNARRHTTESGRGNWYPNGSAMQSAQHQLSSIFQAGGLSSVGQDLCQSGSAAGSRSVQQQVVAYVVPASTIGLSGSSFNSMQERSGSLNPASVNGLSPSQISGGQNAGQHFQGSSCIDVKEANEVDLTLGLSNRVIEEASKSAPYSSFVTDKMEGVYKNHTEQVNTTSKGMHQESKHTNKGDGEQSASLIKGLSGLPHRKDPESNVIKMTRPNEDMETSGLVQNSLSVTVPCKSTGDDVVLTQPLMNKLVDGGVPFSWKEKLEFSVSSDLAWKDNTLLNGMNGVRPEVLQATESGSLRLANLEKKDFSKQLLGNSIVQQTLGSNVNSPTSVHSCRNKQIHSYGVPRLTVSDTKVDGFNETVNAAQEGQSYNVHEAQKEARFSCHDSKQTWVAECQFSFLQQAAGTVQVDTDLHEKTIQGLGLKVKGSGEEGSMHMEMEAIGATGDCEGKVKRQSDYQTVSAKVQAMPIESYSCGEITNKGVVDDGANHAKSSLEQEVETEVQFDTNMHKKTTQNLGLKVEGSSEDMAMHMGMEVVNATGDHKIRVESQLDYQTFPVKVEVMPSKSYFNGENINEGVVEEGKSPANSFLRVSISDTSSRVRLLKQSSIKTCGLLDDGHENQNASEEVLCHSGPGRINMMGEAEIKNDIWLDEADSKTSNCTEILAHAVTNYMEKGSKHTLDTAKKSSCSSQLRKIEHAVSCSSGSSSEGTHIAAETLLRIASEMNWNLSDVDFFQPQNAAGQKTSLEWFADMIPSDANGSELANAASREDTNESFLSPDSGCDAKETDLRSTGCHSAKGLDFFESMTLMLTECSVDEYCKPFGKEHEGIDKLSSPVNHILRTPRRGKHRWDFQRETLPGILSLSRQEITEDLQIIGGLMRAAGDVCQIGFTRRNAGTFASRDDWFIPLRARRSRPLAISQGNGDLMMANGNQESDRVNGILWTSTWGETIRRRRMHRHRAPLSSLALNPP